MSHFDCDENVCNHRPQDEWTNEKILSMKWERIDPPEPYEETLWEKIWPPIKLVLSVVLGLVFCCCIVKVILVVVSFIFGLSVYTQTLLALIVGALVLYKINTKEPHD